MAKRNVRSNPRAASSFGNKDVCPICGGSGWEMYSAPAEIYGGKMAQFAKKCSRCAGKTAQEDFSGIPFAECDITRFNFEAYSVNLNNIKKIAMSLVDNFEKWQNSGKGIYLWSKTSGSGKTYLASCITRSLMLKYHLQAKFVTVPDYISCVGDSYKRERGERDKSEIIRSCQLLILDDLGAQISRDWQSQELFRLINKRMSEGLVTFYTSNMAPENLNLDDRIINRIVKSSIVIQLPEESIRLKKAKSEQEAFLKNILG